MAGPVERSASRLAGRTVWITCGDSGAGRVIASALAAAGAAIAVGFIDPSAVGGAHHDERLRAAEALDGILDAVVMAGARGLGGQLDLSSADARQRFADHVQSELGPISVLVTVVSIGWTGGASDTAERASLRLDDQLEGALRMVDLLVPGMEERGWGRVITVIEVRDGRRETLDQALAAQASLQSMTRGMALDAAPAQGVAYFLIGPAGSADPAKLATLVVALCSDEAASLSGQTVALGAGGRTTA
ncbi:SDR family NAD(P)-dependent oxidoreductase [Rhodoligotrophos defluvii]|uniref:SDR family NAD(P)-dependent oxidoreductase n=1 Tax=Rhodoligotrophos defluvii TaxID=2561934 RepID=UPI001485A8F9|nr:SDR family NAD(P)-dependent oxidoreductase [Rhodoligotrophos defluvii]